MTTKWEQMTLMVPEGSRQAVLEIVTQAGFPHIAIYINENGAVFRTANSGERITGHEARD